MDGYVMGLEGTAPSISYPHILKTKYSEKDSNLQPAPSSIPVLQILEKGDALSKIELSEHKKDSSMLYTGTSKTLNK